MLAPLLSVFLQYRHQYEREYLHFSVAEVFVAHHVDGVRHVPGLGHHAGRVPARHMVRHRALAGRALHQAALHLRRLQETRAVAALLQR